MALPDCYTNNCQNQRLGRANQPKWTQRKHQDGSTTELLLFMRMRNYVLYIYTGRRDVYTDNHKNRKLGRVGLPQGTFIEHTKDGSTTRALFYSKKTGDFVFSSYDKSGQRQSTTYHNCKYPYLHGPLDEYADDHKYQKCGLPVGDRVRNKDGLITRRLIEGEKSDDSDSVFYTYSLDQPQNFFFHNHESPPSYRRSSLLDACQLLFKRHCIHHVQLLLYKEDEITIARLTLS